MVLLSIRWGFLFTVTHHCTHRIRKVTIDSSTQTIQDGENLSKMFLFYSTINSLINQNLFYNWMQNCLHIAKSVAFSLQSDYKWKYHQWMVDSSILYIHKARNLSKFICRLQQYQCRQSLPNPKFYYEKLLFTILHKFFVCSWNNMIFWFFLNALEKKKGVRNSISVSCLIILAPTFGFIAILSKFYFFFKFFPFYVRYIQLTIQNN